MIANILTSLIAPETLLVTALSIVGLAWRRWVQPWIKAKIKASRWAEQLSRLEIIVEGVVKSIYEDTVRALKSDGPGGRKLTDDERRAIILRARDMTIAAASEVGIDALGALGHTGIDALVAAAVAAAKPPAPRDPAMQVLAERFGTALARGKAIDIVDPSETPAALT